MSITVYTNDLGSVALTPRDEKKLEEYAKGVQAACWRMYGDEMVGVLEADHYCNNVTREWDARILAEHQRRTR